MSTMTNKLSAADFVGPSRSSGTQVCYQTCPVCGATNWKLYLNPTTGAWFCFAGRHNSGGKVDVGAGYNPMAALRERLSGQVARAPWAHVELPPHHALSKLACVYLDARGFPPDRMRELGAVELQSEERVCVPFRGLAGTYVYWTARAYIREVTPKYMSAPGRHPLYVLPRWEPAPLAVLVEGVFDAIAVHLHTGLPVRALCGKSLPRYLEEDLRELCSDRVVMLLDPDALGNALQLASRLRSRHATSVVPLPDQRDPADLGIELKEVLRDYL